MFDFSWSELALIAVVALVVIGPKDLPRVLRSVGIWVSKARGMAREFQSSVDQMVREAELDDVRKEIEKASQVNIAKEIENSIDPKGEIQSAVTAPVELETSPTAEIPASTPVETQPVLEAPAIESLIPEPASSPAPEENSAPKPSRLNKPRLLR